MSNAIAPVNEGNVKDYNRPDSRVIYLVKNYNPNTGEADAIGVLGIDWRLIIKDYQEKKQLLKHETKLTIKTRSVLYDNVNVLEGDVQFIKVHFKDDIFSVIPPKTKKLNIFSTLPPANEHTFLQSLPLTATNEFSDVIVLYGPNLQSVGALDNSESDLESSYSKSITSGFTFSMTQKLTVGAEFEAGVVFVKGKFSISLELSFTQEWNTSQTETISFTAEGREKAYTYQGYLLSRKLRFSPETRTFKYVEEEGRFMTNVLKTTNEPIAGVVNNMQNI